MRTSQGLPYESCDTFNAFNGGNLPAMAWRFYEIRSGEKRMQVLLDNRFADEMPTAQLRDLAWFGVWCREDPGGAYWSPNEAPKLDELEEDLIALTEKHGNGWAVYLRRHATPGVREYYFYFGSGADLSKVAVLLRERHAGYRIEYETRPDPKWSSYTAWLKEAPGG